MLNEITATKPLQVSQPPKKKIVIIDDIKIMFEYSPRKNMANIIEEYSTLYPATSSASASGKSKGALFVSANIEIKKTIAQGNNGKTNQTVFCCTNTISVKFNEPASKIIGKITKLIATSYEIICAADRKAPKKAYFELLDQPAIIIPYTFSDDILSKNNKPQLIFAGLAALKKICKCKFMLEVPIKPKGITLQPTKLKVKITFGAKRKPKGSALVGTINSFTINFKPSASGCNKPRYPTTSGPCRR